MEDITRPISPITRRVARPVAAAVGEITHGSAVAGGASTAAGDTVIGTVTLPAGGPWLIHHVWSLIAAATSTAAESFGGYFRLLSLDGDVEPNPAPSRFPTGIGGSFLGATEGARVDFLKLWSTAYQAPGKARIQLIYNEPTVVTAATQVILGLIYGKRVPEPQPIVFMDFVRAQVAAAVDTLVGTITLAEKARRITAIGCQIGQDNVIVAGEELLGFFRLSSDDINMAPAQFPCNVAFSGGLGTVIEQLVIPPPAMIPVDIPVIGGARIDCFIDLNTAVTNAAEIEVFIAYE